MKWEHLSIHPYIGDNFIDIWSDLFGRYQLTQTTSISNPPNLYSNPGGGGGILWTNYRLGTITKALSSLRVIPIIPNTLKISDGSTYGSRHSHTIFKGGNNN